MSGLSSCSDTLGMTCRQRVLTPLSAVLAGAAAAAAGTLAMDLLRFVRSTPRRDLAAFMDWEFSADLRDWEQAPPPAQIGKRIFEGVFQRPLAPEHARVTNNLVHWLYGMSWGALYGIVAGSIRVAPILSGLVFGPLVWASGYTVLVPAKLYRPMWEYDGKTNWEDISGHLAYGVTTAVAFASLAR